MAEAQQNPAGQAPVAGYRGLLYRPRLPSFHVSLEELARLFRELEEKTSESVELQISNWAKRPDQTDQQFEAIKADARHAGKLQVVIIGAKGEQIVAFSADALTAADVPDTVQTVNFDSNAGYSQRFGAAYQLLNRFKLFLDFTEPPLRKTLRPLGSANSQQHGVRGNWSQ